MVTLKKGQPFRLELPTARSHAKPYTGGGTLGISRALVQHGCPESPGQKPCLTSRAASPPPGWGVRGVEVSPPLFKLPRLRNAVVGPSRPQPRGGAPAHSLLGRPTGRSKESSWPSQGPAAARLLRRRGSRLRPPFGALPEAPFPRGGPGSSRTGPVPPGRPTAGAAGASRGNQAAFGRQTRDGTAACEGLPREAGRAAGGAFPTPFPPPEQPPQAALAPPLRRLAGRGGPPPSGGCRGSGAVAWKRQQTKSDVSGPWNVVAGQRRVVCSLRPAAWSAETRRRPFRGPRGPSRAPRAGLQSPWHALCPPPPRRRLDPAGRPPPTPGPSSPAPSRRAELPLPARRTTESQGRRASFKERKEDPGRASTGGGGFSPGTAPLPPCAAPGPATDAP